MSEYVAQSIIISDICHLLPSPRVLSPLAASTFLGERKGQISAFHIREKNHVSHYNAKSLYMSKYVARSITFFEICHLLPSPRVLGSSRCHNFSRREYGCKFQTFTSKKKSMSVITMQKTFICPNTSRNP